MTEIVKVVYGSWSSYYIDVPNAQGCKRKYECKQKNKLYIWKMKCVIGMIIS